MIFSAELIQTDDCHRVKIRCPDYTPESRHASEAHACARFVRDNVVGWIKDNISGDCRRLNYATFDFADYDDALLCYLRFK